MTHYVEICYNIDSSQDEIIGGYHMLTAKDAREFSEQSQKELEMKKPSKIEIRWIKRKIERASKRGEREYRISGFASIRNYCYLSHRGDVMKIYLRSQGYTVILGTECLPSGLFPIMIIEW